MLRATYVIALVAVTYARIVYRQQYGRIDARIVNGTDAQAGKYPSMVSYQILNSHSCGGTILNENWVLTAAHCVFGDNLSFITILSGTLQLDSGGMRHRATKLVPHENYNWYTLINDVALIQVDPPFIWDSTTQPVVLPVQNQKTAGGSNASVTGWGYPYSGGEVVNHLQEVNYWIVSDQECRDVHTSTVWDTNICAYYPGGGKGQCSGDSGGPLWVNGQQVGIVSWSEKPCTAAPYPGVFTKVSPYVDWIYSHIN